LRLSEMKKLPTYLALFGSLVFCLTPALAQEAAQSGYGPSPGYETPQSDSYRGQAQTFGNTTSDSSTWARQQAIDSSNNNNTPSSTSNPIKPTHEGLGKLGRAVGHIANGVGRAAAPVAAMGAYYMITQAATTAGMKNAMMAQRMGMPMGGGYGMGMPMGGYGMGMPMGGYGMGMPMMGGYNPMMNMMRGY
jgi:hypothetical protein